MNNKVGVDASLDRSLVFINQVHDGCRLSSPRRAVEQEIRHVPFRNHVLQNRTVRCI